MKPTTEAAPAENETETPAPKGNRRTFSPPPRKNAPAQPSKDQPAPGSKSLGQWWGEDSEDDFD